MTSKVENLICVCSYCKSVRIDQNTWKRMPLFTFRRDRVSHGACPSCFDSVMSSLQNEITAEAAAC